jgi:hypothetical protein
MFEKVYPLDNILIIQRIFTRNIPYYQFDKWNEVRTFILGVQLGIFQKITLNSYVWTVLPISTNNKPIDSAQQVDDMWVSKTLKFHSGGTTGGVRKNVPSI